MLVEFIYGMFSVGSDIFADEESGSILIIGQLPRRIKMS
jgi:hypothetical protein